MNYIFLDVDGVLNNHDYLMVCGHEWSEIDTRSVAWLARLAKEYDAKIILSSSWRRGYKDNTSPLEPKEKRTFIYKDKEYVNSRWELIDALAKYNLELFDKTGVCYEGDRWERPSEIYNYIKANLKSGDNWVIFDDEPELVTECHHDILSYIKPHFVRTNAELLGLDRTAYNKAKEIFEHA